MDLLTEAQIDLIQTDLRKKGISDLHLEDDLLDHVCCIVEENMATGMTFTAAYDVVIQKFGPAGFRRIQKDTTFFLNLSSSLYKVVIAMDHLMTVLLFLVSCSFILSPAIVGYFYPSLFHFLLSVPFLFVGCIVMISGFDFKNFDTRKSSSNIRTIKI